MNNPVRVICTCVSFGCAERSVITEFGTHQPGKFVAASTRSSHRAKDRALSQEKLSSALNDPTVRLSLMLYIFELF
jgi:hypothetical protein